MIESAAVANAYPYSERGWFDNARRLTRIAKLVGAADDTTITNCGVTPSVVTGDDPVTLYEYSVDNDRPAGEVRALLPVVDIVV